jgi:predicted dienelactone hydrolase
LETGRQGEDTGVLPESISTQTTTDIQIPTDLASGNPDGVTPPDTGTLPPLGTIPSDNPTEVQLPADLSTSPLPPVETGV